MQLFTLRRINAMRSRNELIARRYGLPAIAAVALLTTSSLGAAVASVEPANQNLVADTSSEPSRITDKTKAPTKISDVVLRVTNALANGDISPTQAAELILAAQQNLQTAEAFAMYKQDVMEAYKAGTIERVEIRPKLAAFKKQLTTTMMNQLMERMSAAVQNGTMTDDDVSQIWSTYKTMSKQASQRLTRINYAAAEKKLEAQVESGGITEAQMNEKLSAMREAIAKANSAPKSLTREDYAQAQAKMQAMVEAGEITGPQMKERLVAMRAMIGKSKIAPKTVTREDYAQAQAKMQAMVEAGKITEEQMNIRLGEMRRMIGRDGDQARSSDGDAFNWDGYLRRMRFAVENGRMTEEEAREAIGSMRRRMAAGGDGAERRADGGERGEHSDECLTLRRRLGAAVSNGDMTREEAGEVWRAEGCGN